MTSDEIKENRAGNTFPGIGGVTALTDWREYYPAMDYVLNNISQAADGTITFDFGTATGIDGVMADKQGGEDMRIYMPDGRYAGNSIDALPSGLYIMNGKKIVK